MPELNKEQLDAVSAQNKNIAIIAGPGTGKTKTLVARLSKILKEDRGSKNIVAITFTNKAAKEIKDRIGKKHQNLFVGTFHSFALQNIDDDLKIASSKELKLAAGKQALGKISFFKNTLARSNEVEEYNQKLRDLNLVDFDDLLIIFLKKITDGQIKLKVDVLLVDEFQDTSPLQYEIIKAINAKENFVIGDPNQSIYSFRGANAQVFKKFCKEFGDVRLIKLLSNYRNSKNIIKAYNNLFPQNFLVPTTDNDGEIKLIVTNNENTEASWVIEKIKKEAGGFDILSATSTTKTFSDFAILYRNHALVNVLEKKLNEYGIPYQKAGEGSIYDDEEISELIERLIQDEKFSVNDLVESIKDPNNKNLFVSLNYKFLNKEKKLFISHIEKIKETDNLDFQSNLITLSTLHASKGLEFNNVFILGCEEFVNPDVDLDEEKRLFYVGLSRAKESVYLIKADKRFGRKTKELQFLKFLNIGYQEDENLVKFKEKRMKYKLKKSQKTLF